MSAASPSYRLTRLCFQRALAFVYAVAFLATLQQFPGLIGSHGLLPVAAYVKEVRFWEAPSLFLWNSSDAAMAAAAWAGLFLALVALSGLSERFGAWVSAAVWSGLWALYLSFVNVGQVFYGFGWETMTLEAGFLAVFFGSEDVEPPAVIVWFLRWVLFRLMFGAGLIKLRGDECWRDFTCMFYHYETQPIPNPLSWYFHHMPHALQKFETLFSLFVELPVPFLYFLPGFLGLAGGILTVLFQFTLILSGNLSWLNYLTITIAIACFDDTALGRFLPRPARETRPAGPARKVLLLALTALILFLSVSPTKNLFSDRQAMNTSFEPLHLVNAYGAFGSVTKQRAEIVFEGTEEWTVTPQTRWKEYEFRFKPGDPHRMPPVVAPYQPRLDWLLWFAAMSDWREYPWLLNLAGKMLQNDRTVLGLLAKNPFPDHPPHYVRATLYRYRFSTPEERRRTGDWWTRSPLGLYLPPVSLDNERFTGLLRELGWL
ncbi:MAG TPA: lipase maturation factor family protein [Candidatus Eisenbacteria bacterium]|nr:lipase maturation factor family protein [Candidatus Eisenbacteria bacterium]